MYDRVFMLEISGPTLALVRERLDHLPNFRRFLDRGAWSRLEGPLQPTVATSYAAFYTGKNPGKTGFFDFFRFPAGSYDRIPYSLSDLGEETFYRRLSDHGKRVGLLNALFTHPLPEIEGRTEDRRPADCWLQAWRSRTTPNRRAAADPSRATSGSAEHCSGP